uniref:Uncharacterized protein n=1 Tax=Zea mays TaxID=4577 RepID=C4J5S2_MAIZE|nr:unknown [Zea mays]ACR36696.1 unknown [Zea mays]
MRTSRATWCSCARPCSASTSPASPAPSWTASASSSAAASPANSSAPPSSTPTTGTAGRWVRRRAWSSGCCTRRRFWPARTSSASPSTGRWRSTASRAPSS